MQADPDSTSDNCHADPENTEYNEYGRVPFDEWRSRVLRPDNNKMTNLPKTIPNDAEMAV